jgi:hypothetical protein
MGDARPTRNLVPDHARMDIETTEGHRTLILSKGVTVLDVDPYAPEVLRDPVP